LTLASIHSSLYGHHRCSFVNLKLNVDCKKAITNFMAKINVCSIDELILYFAPFLSKSRDLIFFNLLKKFKLSLVGRMLMIFDNFDGLTLRQINIGITFGSHRDILLRRIHLFRLRAH
jgi:hypothetical protein